jgi:hypothetical protein
MTDKENQLEFEFEEVEKEVFTFWDRLMQWGGILRTFFTLGKLVWAFVFATGAAVVVGEVTDTNPIRDAAVVIGLADERLPADTSTDAYLDELLNLQEEVTLLQEQLANLPLPIPGSQGLDGANGKDGAIGPEGPQGIKGDKGENGMDGDISLMFNDHVDTLH